MAIQEAFHGCWGRAGPKNKEVTNKINILALSTLGGLSVKIRLDRVSIFPLSLPA